jgi:general secretion pathway protein H
MISSPRNRQTGFTLIEVLIVILIISIVTSVSLLTLNRNENRDIETFANELTQMVSLAEEQAMLEPKVLGISFEGNDVQFHSLFTDKESKKQIWQPFNDRILGTYTIPSNVQLSLQVAGNEIKLKDDERKVPPIVISTNGGMTPFILYVGKKGEKPRFAITADADGNVNSASLS